MESGITIEQFNRETILEQKSIRDQSARTAPQRPVSARDLCHHIGLPEAAIGLIQRVMNLETEVMLQAEDIRGLKSQLSALKQKV